MTSATHFGVLTGCQDLCLRVSHTSPGAITAPREAFRHSWGVGATLRVQPCHWVTWMPGDKLRPIPKRPAHTLPHTTHWASARAERHSSGYKVLSFLEPSLKNHSHWLCSQLSIKHQSPAPKGDTQHVLHTILIGSSNSGLPSGASGKEPACQCRRCGFSPCVRKIPWRRKWLPIPVLLTRESHGQRILAGYSP